MSRKTPAAQILSRSAHAILERAHAGAVTRKQAAAVLNGGSGAREQSADVYLHPLAQLGFLRIQRGSPLTYELTEVGRQLIEDADVRQVAGQTATVDLRVALEELQRALGRALELARASER